MKRLQCGMARSGVWLAFVLPIIGLGFVVFVFGPFLNRTYRGPPDARQIAQFNSLNAAIKLYAHQFEGYPPSDANDPTGLAYCGALKLTEAMMGRDLWGFHSLSVYRADGMDVNGRIRLYSVNPWKPEPNDAEFRRGPYLPAESASAFRLADIYGKGNTGLFSEDTFVLCDVYEHERPSGEKTGMPILYYRANRSGTAHDIDNPDNVMSIYSYLDNHALIKLGVPGEPNQVHPLADPAHFYRFTRSSKNKKTSEPYRRDTFILISAGYDGLYGTKDDVCNFTR